MHSALCIMHCALCIAHYALRIMHFSFVWKHPRDLLDVDMGDGRRPAQSPLALPRLVAEDVLLEGLASQKLAGLGPLEALRGAAVRLQLDFLRHVLGSLSLTFATFTTEDAVDTEAQTVSGNKSTSVSSVSSVVEISST